MATDTNAVYHAYQMVYLKNGEEFYYEKELQRVYGDHLRYISSYKRGEMTIHVWWNFAEEKINEKHVKPGYIGFKTGIENPVKKIPQREMTLEELFASGTHKIPESILRERDELKEAGLGVYEIKTRRVLLPLLGISIIPASDASEVAVDLISGDEVEFMQRWWAREASVPNS